MKHYISTSQKAMVELGITGLDFNHMALYEFCKGIIGWKNAKTTTVEGNEYKWVSYAAIMGNMPVLDCSAKTIYRMVERLCDERMLERCPENQKKGMVFLAIGAAGLAYEEYLQWDSTGNDVSMLTSDKNVRPPRTKMSDPSDKNVLVLREDNKENIINLIPHTPFVGSTSEPTDLPIISKKTTRIKKRITFIEASKFYEEEIRSFGLEDPSPCRNQIIPSYIFFTSKLIMFSLSPLLMLLVSLS